MPDTQSVSLGLLLQATGGNDNTWGQNLNDQAIQFIEDAIVGRQGVATTGGTTVLTTAQARPAFIDVTGVLASDATIQVPNTKNQWIITNNTTGAFAVLVKTASGAAISIPVGTSKQVYCDGSNGVFRMDRAQVGEFFFHSGTTVPAGAQECDGAAISRAGIGIDLFAAAGTTWGAGNGTTTFNIPNATDSARYLRSRSGTFALGTAQTSQVESHTHGGSVTSTGTSGGESADHSHGQSGTFTTGGHSADHTHGPGSLSTSSNGDHTHTYNETENQNLGGIPGGGGNTANSSLHTGTTSSAGAHTHAVSFGSHRRCQQRPHAQCHHLRFDRYGKAPITLTVSA